jgi:NitT/TauT family transport system substrate-binding protein
MKNSIHGLLMACSLTVGFSTAVAAQTPVTFQLNWVAGGANAGFAAAVGEGF